MALNMSDDNKNNSIALQLITAANFAAVKHKTQLRKDGVTPYINHPIGVANLLVTIGGIDDVVTLQAALLHDTVEDTDTTIAQIEQSFGFDVAYVVSEVTDDKQLPKAERKRLQIEHAPVISFRAKCVKMADKLYNLRDLISATPIGWSEDRVREYFVWAAKVIKGLKGVNDPLEKELRAVLAQRGVSID